MAANGYYLCFMLLSSLVILVTSQVPCTDSNLEISHSKTGKLISGKPEWEVTLTNTCSCAFAHVVLSCKGFQTVEKIDPDLLKKTGDECSVNYSNAIVGHSSFNFTYAWDIPFAFKLKNAEIACS